MHIEQTILISKIRSDATKCPYPGCDGSLSPKRADQHERKCSICERIADINQAPMPLVRSHGAAHITNIAAGSVNNQSDMHGFELPSLGIDSDLQHFRRIEIRNQSKPLTRDAHERPFICTATGCKWANIGFVFQRDFRIHMFSSHAKLAKDTLGSLESSPPFICGLCQKMFSKKNNLALHVRGHNDSGRHENDHDGKASVCFELLADGTSWGC